ncbi:hypothetical protein [Rhizobium alvei]|uniref:Uncharacterized protein n=1 Tax=Rhizobium alvei TaxID=1132659 RepID=A0ABT8YLA8_9HYPH|nr:hypothetical protein [Rhizobium alvei]MDO6964311.1 hypothetical protein [Rhizobium alvei]
MKRLKVLIVLFAMLLAAILPQRQGFAADCRQAQSHPAISESVHTHSMTKHDMAMVPDTHHKSDRGDVLKKDLCSLLCQMAKIALPLLDGENASNLLTRHAPPQPMRTLLGRVVPPLFDPPRSLSA